MSKKRGRTRQEDSRTGTVLLRVAVLVETVVKVHRTNRMLDEARDAASSCDWEPIREDLANMRTDDVTFAVIREIRDKDDYPLGWDEDCVPWEATE